MIDSVKAEKVERIGYIVFNSAMATVYFERDPSASGSSAHAEINYLTGGSFKQRAGTVVLASIHTHPLESAYLGKYSDQEIFDGQYRADTPNPRMQDGFSGRRSHSPLYSVGKNYVDYYSPAGKSKSKNNLCSNLSLLNGSFNILKHALQEYYTYHY